MGECRGERKGLKSTSTSCCKVYVCHRSPTYSHVEIHDKSKRGSALLV